MKLRGEQKNLPTRPSTMLSKTSLRFPAAVVMLLTVVHLCGSSQDENNKEMKDKEANVKLLIKGLSGTFVHVETDEKHAQDHQDHDIPVEIFGLPVTVDAFEILKPSSLQLYTDSKVEVGMGKLIHKEGFIHLFQLKDDQIAMQQYSPVSNEYFDMLAHWARTNASRFHGLTLENLVLDEGCGITWTPGQDGAFQGESDSACELPNTHNQFKEPHKYEISLRVGEGYNVTVLAFSKAKGKWLPARHCDYKLEQEQERDPTPHSHTHKHTRNTVIDEQDR